MNEKLEKYPKSANGNFYVKDTVPVPHPYCITPRHVAYASDHHSGILDRYAMEQAEKNGVRCGICKGKLRYEDHETALLIGCMADIKENKELHEYLLSIKEMCVADKYAGFAFLDERGA